jgi:hypothetical protein
MPAITNNPIALNPVVAASLGRAIPTAASDGEAEDTGRKLVLGTGLERLETGAD